MRDAILGLVNPLIALVFAATFFAIWIQDRKRKHVLAFGSAYVLLASGFLYSQFLPDNQGRALINLTNIPYFIGTWLMVWAAAQRVGRSVPTPAFVGIGVVGCGLLVASHFFDEFVNVELYIANTAYAVMFLFGAIATADSRKSGLVNAMVFWMLAVTCLQFFIRPSVSFMMEGALAHEGYRQTIYYSLLNAIVAVNSLALAITLINAALQDRFEVERHKAARDTLTGLWSRRAFEAQVHEAFDRAAQERVPLALVVADIDHFKRVNDIWGHQVGDNAISEFGKLLGHSIRATDIAGRVGGEEFCLLIWNVDEGIAARLAERMRQATLALDIDGMGNDVRISASFGVAGRAAQEDYHTLFGKADKALYQAKADGRDRVARASAAHRPSEIEAETNPESQRAA